MLFKIPLKRLSIEKLLSLLFTEDKTSVKAWEEFLKRYSKLILKVCWKFEKDYDKVMQRYLYVCEKLIENDFKILKQYNTDFNEQAPKFSTWLIVVTRNICIDYYRQQTGRRRYPAAVATLSKEDKLFFELYYWKGHSLQEISETLNLYSQAETETADDKLERINSLLLRAPKIYPKTELVPFNEQTFISDSENEHSEAELNIDEKINDWIRKLPDNERVIIRLRFWDGLSAREIADILNISNNQTL